MLFALCFMLCWFVFFRGGIQDVLNGEISVCPTVKGNLLSHFYINFQLQKYGPFSTT